MSRLISEAELREFITTGKVIEHGDVGCAEGVKYDFRLGKHILLPKRQPLSVPSLTEKERSELVLHPGTMAFALSEERLALPPNIKAELSLKRKMSHAGVLVMGGFGVDPGYSGRLLFGLYNFSNAPFPLTPGRKVIAAQFYELMETEIPPATKQDSLESFPDDLVRFMSSYEPATVEGFQVRLHELAHAIDTLREEFKSKEAWFEKFQKLLEGHDKQIEKLTEGLSDEKENRRQIESEFRQRIEDVTRSTQRSSILIGVIVALVAGIVSSVVATVVMSALLNKR